MKPFFVDNLECDYNDKLKPVPKQALLTSFQWMSTSQPITIHKHFQNGSLDSVNLEVLQRFQLDKIMNLELVICEHFQVGQVDAISN